MLFLSFSAARLLSLTGEGERVLLGDKARPSAESCTTAAACTLAQTVVTSYTPQTAWQRNYTKQADAEEQYGCKADYCGEVCTFLLLLLAPCPHEGLHTRVNCFDSAAVYAAEVQFGRGRGLSRGAKNT